MNGHDVLACLEKQRNPRLVEAMKDLDAFQHYPDRQQHRGSQKSAFDPAKTLTGAGPHPLQYIPIRLRRCKDHEFKVWTSLGCEG
jgi:hypothetical protein